MRFRRAVIILLLACASAGCVTFGDPDDDDQHWSLNLGWLIGGIAMAVDGDDRDDHVHWFEEDDDCRCRHR